MRYMLFCLLPLLAGCQTIGNFADSVGDHMPVIGERCENWQCFTEAGQRKSEALRQAKALRGAQPNAAAAPMPVPPGVDPETADTSPY